MWWCYLSVQAQPLAVSVDEVHVWLEKMLVAASQQHYQGVVVLGDQQRWDSYQIRHAQIAGQEYEWIEQLTGAHRLTIRQPEGLYCGHVETQAAHFLLKNPLRPQNSLLENNPAYRFSLGGTDRVAGRWSQKIQILPHDDYRFAVNMWLDLETALLLRTEVLDKQQVLMRAEFSSIDFTSELVADSFKPNIAGHVFEMHDQQLPEYAPVMLRAAWVPDEFQLGYAQQQADGSVRLLYFDGLASFSLFVDDAPPVTTAVQQRWNATGAVVEQVLVNNQPKRVVAVGEVPLKTLKKAAQSIVVITANEAQ